MNAATMNGNCRGSTPNIDPRSQRSPGIYQRGQGDGIVLSKKGRGCYARCQVKNSFAQSAARGTFMLITFCLSVFHFVELTSFNNQVALIV